MLPDAILCTGPCATHRRLSIWPVAVIVVTVVVVNEGSWKELGIQLDGPSHYPLGNPGRGEDGGPGRRTRGSVCAGAAARLRRSPGIAERELLAPFSRRLCFLLLGLPPVFDQSGSCIGRGKEGIPVVQALFLAGEGVVDRRLSLCLGRVQITCLSSHEAEVAIAAISQVRPMTSRHYFLCSSFLLILQLDP